MRTVIAMCSIFFSVALQFAPQDQSKLSADESRILTLENAWNKAEEHKDTQALDQLLASTLAYTDYDGSYYSKAQFLESAKRSPDTIQQLVNSDTTVRSYGNFAVVTGMYHEKGISKGKTYERRGRFTDTWMNQNGTWLCVASQSTLISH
jgi:hypothetical protein